MYIKHMKLVCTTDKMNIQGAAYLDLEPLRIIGSKEVIYRLLNYYKWCIGLYEKQKLFQLYQSVNEINGQTSNSPCVICPQKVICLVSSHTDHNHEWLEKICPFFKGSTMTIPDKKLTGEKVKVDKLGFVLAHKCNLCAHRTGCNRSAIIMRILCKNYKKIEELHELAHERITQTWGSVDRFMAALEVGWAEVHWKPPEGKRRRQFRVAFIHPDHEIELIKNYYPYLLREHPVPAHKLGLLVPEKTESIYTKDDMLTSWVLWNSMREMIDHRKQLNYNKPGYTYICGHSNYLLSMYIDHSGHPMLVTSTSRWKYRTLFSDFNAIGWNMQWSPRSVMTNLLG